MDIKKIATWVVIICGAIFLFNSAKGLFDKKDADTEAFVPTAIVAEI